MTDKACLHFRSTIVEAGTPNVAELDRLNRRTAEFAVGTFG